MRKQSWLTLALIATLVYAAGCEKSAESARSSQRRDGQSRAAGRLTPEEAQARIEAWHEAVGERMPYEQRDSLAEEWTTSEVWDRLEAQVFTLDMQGYLVSADQVVSLGESFGGMGLRSTCVSDLNADGVPELLFTYSFGSGIHRSMVGAWSRGWPEPGVVSASVALRGYPDCMLGDCSNSAAELLVEDQSVGALRLEFVGRAPRLEIDVRDDLPKSIAERLWMLDAHP